MGANNPRVAKLFNEIADLLELKGDNPFRIRAYRRAALSVEALPKDIASVPPEELPELPGIGKDLAGKIRRFLESGRVDLHEELKKDVGEITDEARFIEDLGADSLDIVELVMAMEEEFGIDFPEEEEKKIKTVKDVTEFIQARAK